MSTVLCSIKSFVEFITPKNVPYQERIMSHIDKLVINADVKISFNPNTSGDCHWNALHSLNTLQANNSKTKQVLKNDSLAFIATKFGGLNPYENTNLPMLEMLFIGFINTNDLNIVVLINDDDIFSMSPFTMSDTTDTVFVFSYFGYCYPIFIESNNPTISSFEVRKSIFNKLFK